VYLQELREIKSNLAEEINSQESSNSEKIEIKPKRGKQ
jgi:hypothetical protein